MYNDESTSQRPPRSNAERLEQSGNTEAANALYRLDEKFRALNSAKKDCDALVRINQQWRLKMNLDESIPMIVGQVLDARF